MSGVSRHSGTFATSAQVTVLVIAERRVGGCQQAIMFAIERHGLDAAERFVAEIGDARIDLEIFEQIEEFPATCASRS